jgi:hypothetical protein
MHNITNNRSTIIKNTNNSITMRNSTNNSSAMNNNRTTAAPSTRAPTATAAVHIGRPRNWLLPRKHLRFRKISKTIQLTAICQTSTFH